MVRSFMQLINKEELSDSNTKLFLSCLFLHIKIIKSYFKTL